MRSGGASRSGYSLSQGLSLLRPLNGLLAGAGVLVGAVVGASVRAGNAVSAAGHGPVEWWVAALGALSAFAVAGAANALNDVLDVEEDRVNRPGRPLASGRVSRGPALVLSVFLYCVGLALAWPLGAGGFGLVCSWVLLTALYSLRLKGVPLAGNLVVAAVAASPLLLGGLTQGAAMGGLALLTALAGLLHLARELYKDAEDVEGDREQGVRTLAVARGPDVAVAAGRWLLALTMAAALAPYAAGVMSKAYLVALVPVEALMLWLLVVSRGATKAVAGRVSRLLKIVMALGLVAFLAGAH